MKQSHIVFVVFTALFALIYGVLDATRDTLAHHFTRSIFAGWNAQFWDANLSWCNKWLNCQSGVEKYWGSSTFLSFTTDGWHLVKFFQLRMVAFFPALWLSYQISMEKSILFRLGVFMAAFTLFSLVQSIGFTLCYDYFFITTKN
jgi:hypothetical protein